MKKQVTLFVVGSLAAVMLCGCAGSQRPIPGEESLVNAASSAASEVSSASSAPASASSVSSSEDGASSEPDETVSTAEGEGDTPEASVSDEPEAEDVTGKFITHTTAEVDISDEAMKEAGGLPDDKLSYLIHSVEELRQFADENKDKYALDSVDAGENFSQATSELNEDFFETNNVIIVVQRYKRSDGIMLWEVYDGGTSTMIDIYKNEPEDESEAGYILYVVSGAKDRMGINGVVLNFFPAGSYLSSEPAEEEAGIIPME